MENKGNNSKEENISEKIVEELLLEINSKKFIINDFKDKYLNQNINSNCNNYFQEGKGTITVKINKINQILDSFQRTISLSLKIITFLLIKIKNLKNTDSNNKHLNNNNSVKNSYSSIYNNNIFKSFKDESYKLETDIKNKFLKNSNKSYIFLFNKDKIKLNESNKKNNTNIKYKLINGNNSNYKKINKSETILNNNYKINTNFNNFLKNINIKNLKNNKEININLKSMGFKNTSYIEKNDAAPKNQIKNNIYAQTENNNNNINKKSEYIKIKNYKLKIKSPLRQTLKELVKNQKMKNNKDVGSSNNIINKYKIKIRVDKENKEEENKNHSTNEEKKFNNFRMFFADKYGDGNYFHFLKKYNSNKINKLEVENELNILSKLFNYKNIPINKIKIKSAKKIYHYQTPNTQGNCRKKIRDYHLIKNNSINIINDNYNLTHRYNTNQSNNKEYISFIDYSNKPSYKYHSIINNKYDD